MPPSRLRLNTDLPDPLSRASLQRLRSWPRGAEIDAPHMVTDQTERLILELQRYCEGKIDGLSVLVAGRRGAGKTTMVRLAVQRVLSQQVFHGDDGLIPLPLFLHGPTVVDPALNTAEPEKPSEGSNESAAQPETWVRGGEAPTAEDATRIKENALPRLMTALYRHFSDAICDAWLNAADVSRHRVRARNELLELRGHLDRTLERVPAADTLRKLWKRAGFLRNGVVFYLRPEVQPSPRLPYADIVPPRIAGLATDQGIREIVALSACADAYRGILGATEERLKRRQSDQRQREFGIAPAPSPKAEAKSDDKEKPEKKTTVEKLAPTTLATAAGGLALFKGGSEPRQMLTAGIVALVIGVAVWLAGWAGLNYSQRRRSRQDTESEISTRIDWSAVRTLERQFPVVIRRVKDAGFAPIFVLDELDKMENADRKLDSLLRLTKHLATDHAAFLFLTNRDYYEQLVATEETE